MEVVDILVKYFINVVLSIGGDYVNNIMEEDYSDYSSVKIIWEIYKEINFEFKFFIVVEVE